MNIMSINYLEDIICQISMTWKLGFQVDYNSHPNMELVIQLILGRVVLTDFLKIIKCIKRTLIMLNVKYNYLKLYTYVNLVYKW